MNRVVIDILAIVTAILLLIFSLFTFTIRQGNRLSHHILSAFLLSNALFIIDFISPTIENVLQINLQWLNGVGFAFGFLFGPLLYLYAHSITIKDFQLKKLQYFHFLLFTIYFIVVLASINIPEGIKNIIFNLQIFGYMFFCFAVIIDYRKEIKKYYSSIEKLKLTWMLFVVGAFFFMWLIDLFTFVLYDNNVIDFQATTFFTFISLFINFIFALLLFYKAIESPEYFTGVPAVESHQKYEHSKLSDDEKKQHLVSLLKYFEDTKPFLNASITINDIANELSIPGRYLSQVINENLDKNFYDFINSYRIGEAKKMLLEDFGNKKTVLEILYDCGFNSKSAFNIAFKRHTGYTPTEFRSQKSPV
jgi:AraC-like DNA-binding protein